MIASEGRCFEWKGLAIKLSPCHLKEKNSDWLDAEIVFDNVCVSSLISGYTIVSQWVKDLGSFLDSECMETVTLGLSSALVIEISRQSAKTYSVKIDLSDDPLLDMNTWEFKCSSDEVNNLLEECKFFAAEYRIMIGEA